MAPLSQRGSPAPLGVGEAWWSQAGSNRRPHHCERCALPAELWPRHGRLDQRYREGVGGRQADRHLQSVALPSQERRKVAPGGALARNFPCLKRAEPIFSKTCFPRLEPSPSPCEPFSTSFSSSSICTSGS